MPGRGRAARRGRGRRVQPPRRAANRGQPDMQPDVQVQQQAAPAQPERQPARRAANRGQPDMQPDVQVQQPAAPAQPEQRPAKRSRATADTPDEPDRGNMVDFEEIMRTAQMLPRGHNMQEQIPVL